MTTTRRTGRNGLPVFLAHELAALKREGSTAVMVLDIAGTIQFGTTADPNRWARNIADKAKAAARVISIGWAPDGPLARRIKGAAERMLAGRKIQGGRFDVPDDIALGALDLATARMGIALRSTGDVLASSAVKEIKKRVSRHYFKEVMRDMKARKREEQLLAGVMA